VTDSGAGRKKPSAAWRQPAACRDRLLLKDSAHYSAVPQQDSFPPPNPETPPQAGFVQILGAVFWSFFGIRKKAAGERDAVSIKPQHVIIAGLLGAAILVALVLTLVHFIVHAH
jgi:Protein of unknown function (DUF2970)